MDGLIPRDVILKKIPPALAKKFETARSMRGVRPNVRILIVEDQLFSRRLLQEVLSGGYDLDMAETAKDGTRLFLENAPDIALLDIELDDDSGHNVARFIKSLDPSVFVIMVTGNNSAVDVSMARKNHVDGFILKPYNKGKILEGINKFYTLHPEKKPEG